LSSSILEDIERALDSWGCETKQIIYWNYEQTYCHSRSDIPDNVDDFLQSIKDFFGEALTRQVERKIVEEMKRSKPELKGFRGQDLGAAFEVLLLREALEAL
jgi:hypothetical protein